MLTVRVRFVRATGRDSFHGSGPFLFVVYLTPVRCRP